MRTRREPHDQSLVAFHEQIVARDDRHEDVILTGRNRHLAADGNVILDRGGKLRSRLDGVIQRQFVRHAAIAEDEQLRAVLPGLHRRVIEGKNSDRGRTRRHVIVLNGQRCLGCAEHVANRVGLEPSELAVHGQQFPAGERDPVRPGDHDIRAIDVRDHVHYLGLHRGQAQGHGHAQRAVGHVIRDGSDVQNGAVRAGGNGDERERLVVHTAHRRAVADVEHAQVTVRAARAADLELAGRHRIFHGIAQGPDAHLRKLLLHGVQPAHVARRDLNRVFIKPQRLRAILKRINVIVARRHVADGEIALAVRPADAVGRAGAAVVNARVRERIAEVINQLARDDVSVRHAHGDDHPRAAHAAFHVRDFAAHHVFAGRAELVGHRRGVESERVVPEIPVVGHAVAVRVRGGHVERHRAADGDACDVRRERDVRRDIRRVATKIHHHVNVFVRACATLGDWCDEHGVLRIGVGAPDHDGAIVLAIGRTGRAVHQLRGAGRA